MSKSPQPEECLKIYDELVAMFPEIQRKGKKVPYTSLNGHMFSYLGPDGTMALRMGKEDREKFLLDFNTELDVQYGSVMKEYPKVPRDLQFDLEAVKPYFAKSLAYVKTLKPK